MNNYQLIGLYGDKEYKTGDDMLYGQFLRDNGDDLQGLMVVRRNLVVRTSTRKRRPI